MSTLQANRGNDLDALMRERRPGFSMPRPFYADAGVFRIDMERIIQRQWMYAGHVSRIPREGDYFLYELGEESIVIIRGRGDEVHALFNVCRHRGSRVCLEPEGHAKRLVCSYHQWVYDTDGSLLAAQHMPERFDRSSFGMKRCHVRTIGGLIFVNLGEHPADFDPIAKELGEFLAPYQLQRTRVAHTEGRPVHANWKLIMENFIECYHCPKGHPEWCAVHDVVLSDKGPRTNPARIAEAHQRVREKGWPTDERLYTGPDKSFIIWRTSVRAGAVTESEDGQLMAPLLGDNTDPYIGITGFQSMPSLWVHICVDHAVLIRFTPRSARTTDVEVTWLVRDDAVEGRDFDPRKVSWVWRITGEQDYVLCENNQLGVNSTRYQPGPYATIEQGPERFIQWYFERLNAAK